MFKPAANCILEVETANLTGKVKGPASYFPAIEAKYGKSIAEWQEALRAREPAKHMELVQFLKDEHGMGHGHANALVAATIVNGDQSFGLKEQ